MSVESLLLITSPVSPYGRTKLDCEIMAEECMGSGMQIIGLRYFNVFGRGENPNYARVIPRFLNNISRGEPPVIFGDGSHVKDFTFVQDVVEANVLAMRSSVGSGFFNIGGSRPVTLRQLAWMLISLLGANVEPLYDRPRRGDPKMSAADITKAARVLGWRPKVSLEEGLRTLLHDSNSL
ncbi:MAG: NAD-dependent epimerase/dehydratase family protein [Nitrosopumilaceae archaeon]|nr:NAD-dependent epimerase/dehydratase family protein [Nitrosopumilaceae archaeon]